MTKQDDLKEKEEVTFSWKASKDTDDYEIYRDDNNGNDEFNKLATTKETTLLAKDLKKG